jgi:hypothetical protein
MLQHDAKAGRKDEKREEIYGSEWRGLQGGHRGVVASGFL